MLALAKTDKKGVYFEAVIKSYEQYGHGYCVWRALGLFPGRAIAKAQSYLRNPTPANMRRLQDSSSCWGTFDPEFLVLNEAFSSDNAELRKIALGQPHLFYYVSSYKKLEKHSPRLIDSAEGKLPNSDPDEQRCALMALEALTAMPAGSYPTAPLGLGCKPAPLTPAEQKRIGKLCKVAREKFIEKQ